MSLALPELQPGWYEAALVMTSQGQFVGKQTLNLVLLADDAASSPPNSRFGIVVTDLPFEGWDDLPEILTLLRAGRVKLPVWSQAGDVQQMDSARFDQLLSRLSELRIEPTACLIDLPPEIAERLHGPETSTLERDEEPGWVQLLHADPQLGNRNWRTSSRATRPTWNDGSSGPMAPTRSSRTPA